MSHPRDLSAFADWLITASPEELAELAAMQPTSERDQLDAATAEAGGRGQRASFADVPRRVLLATLSTYAAWADGSASSCAHHPQAGRPQPVHASTSRPGVVVCGSCVRLLGRHGPRACDACRDTPATEVEGVVYGPMRFAFAVCDSCAGQINRARHLGGQATGEGER